MRVRIGYACINTAIRSANRTVRLANATPQRVVALGQQNLPSLAEILRWNDREGIRLFRISSDIIPLASHPAVQVDWRRALSKELHTAGELIRASGVRVSMHPGQYTVLNSPREEVVEASLAELEYHTQLLDALGAGPECKLVLHLGGVYQDKAGSMQRFAQNYRRLSASVQSRLVLENDERNYTVEDALALSTECGAPVVFDLFHHTCLPSLHALGVERIILRCAATWGEKDGPPKLHYSDQWAGKKPGSHSQSVDLDGFGRYYALLRELGRDLDVMLEVKDKEQSVLAIFQRFSELSETHEKLTKV